MTEVQHYVMAFLLGIVSPILLNSQTVPKQPSRQTSVASVPFVGCRSDGQMGRRQAPAGKKQAVAIPVSTAERLAYYKAEDDFGVLAPQGWYCFATYGSNGASLYVSPEPIKSKLLLSSDDWKGFAGPAIQLSLSIGDTSGRFQVARIIARVFPAYSWFVQRVIDEGIEPASEFPSGPFEGDMLVYKSKRIVEFQTPANTDGLGTSSQLQKSGIPISGVAILFGQEPSLLQLSMRLTPETENLERVIVRETEREVKRSEAESGQQTKDK